VGMGGGGWVAGLGVEGVVLCVWGGGEGGEEGGGVWGGVGGGERGKGWQGGEVGGEEGWGGGG